MYWGGWGGSVGWGGGGGVFFFFQAEDGIRDLVRSRGLGDVYKRQSSFEVNSTFSGGVLLATTASRSTPASNSACLTKSRRDARTTQALSLIHI